MTMRARSKLHPFGFQGGEEGGGWRVEDDDGTGTCCMNIPVSNPDGHPDGHPEAIPRTGR